MLNSLKRFAIGLAAVCLLGAAMLPLSAQQATDEKTQILQLLNAWRIEQGLFPFVENETLMGLANYHADYLMTLREIPLDNTIHTGPGGQTVLNRARLPQFDWQPYGKAERVSITEIAATGSPRFAVNWWRGSGLHSRSVTNTAYREIGIAVRPHTFGSLYIVVLGGEPNRLPVYFDLDDNLLYLSNEYAPFSQTAGNWIQTATRYRLLDARLSAQTDWQPWQPTLPLPQNLGELFYVEFEDAKGTLSLTGVDLIPDNDFTFSVSPALVFATNTPPPIPMPSATPALVFATNTPLQAATIAASSTLAPAFASNTPQPSATPVAPTAAPTLLPASPTAEALLPTSTRASRAAQGELVLLYDETGLTLYHTGRTPLNVENLTLIGENYTLEAIRWERVTGGLDAAALPGNDCLQVTTWEFASGIPTPSQCSFVRSFITLAPSRAFWREGSFQVADAGEVLATCAAAAGSCIVPWGD